MRLASLVSISRNPAIRLRSLHGRAARTTNTSRTPAEAALFLCIFVTVVTPCNVIARRIYVTIQAARSSSAVWGESSRGYLPSALAPRSDTSRALNPVQLTSRMWKKVIAIAACIRYVLSLVPRRRNIHRVRYSIAFAFHLHYPIPLATRAWDQRS